MAIEVPAGVQKLFLVLTGEQWPTANEDHLREVALAWGTAGDRLQSELLPDLVRAVQEIRMNFTGKSAIKFADMMGPYATDPPYYIPEAAKQFQGFKEFLDDAAAQVEYTKLITIEEIVLLILQIAWAIAMAYWSAGASMTWLAARFAIVRTLLASWWGRLLLQFAMAQLFGIGFQVALDVLTQAVQFAKGTRTKWDARATVMAVEVGAVGGVLALPFSAISHWLAHKVSAALVKHLPEDMSGAMRQVVVRAVNTVIGKFGANTPISTLTKDGAKTMARDITTEVFKNASRPTRVVLTHAGFEIVEEGVHEVITEGVVKAINGQGFTPSGFSMTSGMAGGIAGKLGEGAGHLLTAPRADGYVRLPDHPDETDHTSSAGGTVNGTPPLLVTSTGPGSTGPGSTGSGSVVDEDSGYGSDDDSGYGSGNDYSGQSGDPSGDASGNKEQQPLPLTGSTSSDSNPVTAGRTGDQNSVRTTSGTPGTNTGDRTNTPAATGDQTKTTAQTPTPASPKDATGTTSRTSTPSKDAVRTTSQPSTPVPSKDGQVTPTSGARPPASANSVRTEPSTTEPTTQSPATKSTTEGSTTKPTTGSSTTVPRSDGKTNTDQPTSEQKTTRSSSRTTTGPAEPTGQVTASAGTTQPSPAGNRTNGESTTPNGPVREGTRPATPTPGTTSNSPKQTEPAATEQAVSGARNAANQNTAGPGAQTKATQPPGRDPAQNGPSQNTNPFGNGAAARMKPAAGKSPFVVPPETTSPRTDVSNHRVPVEVADYTAIRKAMTAAGPGAQGMVIVNVGGKGLDRIFNVVHDTDRVVFFDGRTGKESVPPAEFHSLRFLPTSTGFPHHAIDPRPAPGPMQTDRPPTAADDGPVVSASASDSPTVAQPGTPREGSSHRPAGGTHPSDSVPGGRNGDTTTPATRRPGPSHAEGGRSQDSRATSAEAPGRGNDVPPVVGAGDRLSMRWVEEAADDAAERAAAAESAQQRGSGPVPGREWSEYCLILVQELGRQLFPDGIRTGQVHDDGLIGTGTKGPDRYLGAPNTMWAAAGYWNTLAPAVTTAEVGTAAFLVISRPNQIGHAVALIHTSDHGLVLVNPTTHGDHATFPVPDLIPSEVTGREHGPTVGEALDRFADVGPSSEVRALIITPDGRVVTPTPAPASTARALTDPSDPHAGARKVRRTAPPAGPWNAPGPENHGDTPTTQDLDRLAWHAFQDGVASIEVFADGLARAGWHDVSSDSVNVQRAWNGRWAERAGTRYARPTDEQLRNFARFAIRTGAKTHTTFYSGLAARDWGELGKNYSRALKAWSAAKTEERRSKAPEWATKHIQDGDPLTDAKVRDVAREARLAGETNSDKFLKGVAYAGGKGVYNKEATQEIRNIWKASESEVSTSDPARDEVPTGPPDRSDAAEQPGPGSTLQDRPGPREREPGDCLMYALIDVAGHLLPEDARDVQQIRDQLADELRDNAQYRADLYEQARTGLAEDFARSQGYERDGTFWTWAVNQHRNTHLNVDWDRIIDQLRTPGSWDNAAGEIAPTLAGWVFELHITVHQPNTDYTPQIGFEGGHAIELFRNENHWERYRPGADGQQTGERLESVPASPSSAASERTQPSDVRRSRTKRKARVSETGLPILADASVPAHAHNVIMYLRNRRLVASGLFRIDPAVLPLVLAEIEALEPGVFLTWRYRRNIFFGTEFDLQDGVTGLPITANDVQRSVARHADTASRDMDRGPIPGADLGRRHRAVLPWVLAEIESRHPGDYLAWWQDDRLHYGPAGDLPDGAIGMQITATDHQVATIRHAETLIYDLNRGPLTASDLARRFDSAVARMVFDAIEWRHPGRYRTWRVVREKSRTTYYGAAEHVPPGRTSESITTAVDPTEAADRVAHQARLAMEDMDGGVRTLDNLVHIDSATRPLVLNEVERQQPGRYRSWWDGGVRFGTHEQVPAGVIAARINATPFEAAAARYANLLIGHLDSDGPLIANDIHDLRIDIALRPLVVTTIETHRPGEYLAWWQDGDVHYGRANALPDGVTGLRITATDGEVSVSRHADTLIRGMDDGPLTTDDFRDIDRAVLPLVFAEIETRHSGDYLTWRQGDSVHYGTVGDLPSDAESILPIGEAGLPDPIETTGDDQPAPSTAASHPETVPGRPSSARPDSTAPGLSRPANVGPGTSPLLAPAEEAVWRDQMQQQREATRGRDTSASHGRERPSVTADGDRFFFLFLTAAGLTESHTVDQVRETLARALTDQRVRDSLPSDVRDAARRSWVIQEYGGEIDPQLLDLDLTWRSIADQIRTPDLWGGRAWDRLIPHLAAHAFHRQLLIINPDRTQELIGQAGPISTLYHPGDHWGATTAASDSGDPGPAYLGAADVVPGEDDRGLSWWHPAGDVHEAFAEQYGWLEAVNPYRAKGGESTTNCLLTSIATDSTLKDKWAGDDFVHVAPPSAKSPPDHLTNYGGRSAETATGYQPIVDAMAAAGPGARGMVSVKGRGAGHAHVFNVFHDSHGVVFLDGQTGRHADLPADFQTLQFLPTSDRSPRSAVGADPTTDLDNAPLGGQATSVVVDSDGHQNVGEEGGPKSAGEPPVSPRGSGFQQFRRPMSGVTISPVLTAGRVKVTLRDAETGRALDFSDFSAILQTLRSRLDPVGGVRRPAVKPDDPAPETEGHAATTSEAESVASAAPSRTAGGDPATAHAASTITPAASAESLPETVRTSSTGRSAGIQGLTKKDHQDAQKRRDEAAGSGNGSPGRIRPTSGESGGVQPTVEDLRRAELAESAVTGHAPEPGRSTERRRGEEEGTGRPSNGRLRRTRRSETALRHLGERQGGRGTEYLRGSGWLRADGRRDAEQRRTENTQAEAGSSQPAPGSLTRTENADGTATALQQPTPESRRKAGTRTETTRSGNGRTESPQSSPQQSTSETVVPESARLHVTPTEPAQTAPGHTATQIEHALTRLRALPRSLFEELNRESRAIFRELVGYVSPSETGRSARVDEARALVAAKIDEDGREAGAEFARSLAPGLRSATPPARIPQEIERLREARTTLRNIRSWDERQHARIRQEARELVEDLLGDSPHPAPDRGRLNEVVTLAAFEILRGGHTAAAELAVELLGLPPETGVSLSDRVVSAAAAAVTDVGRARMTLAALSGDRFTQVMRSMQQAVGNLTGHVPADRIPHGELSWVDHMGLLVAATFARSGPVSGEALARELAPILRPDTAPRVSINRDRADVAFRTLEHVERRSPEQYERILREARVIVSRLTGRMPPPPGRAADPYERQLVVMWAMLASEIAWSGHRAAENLGRDIIGHPRLGSRLPSWVAEFDATSRTDPDRAQVTLGLYSDTRVQEFVSAAERIVAGHRELSSADSGDVVQVVAAGIARTGRPEEGEALARHLAADASQRQQPSHGTPNSLSDPPRSLDQTVDGTAVGRVDGLPVAIWLPGAPQQGLPTATTTIEQLGRLAETVSAIEGLATPTTVPPDAVFVLGAERDGQVIVDGRPVSPERLYAVITFTAPGRLPFLLIPGAAAMAEPLARLFNGPVYAATEAMRFEPDDTRLSFARPGPDGRPVEEPFRRYVAGDLLGVPVATSLTAAPPAQHDMADAGPASGMTITLQPPTPPPSGLGGHSAGTHATTKSHRSTVLGQHATEPVPDDAEPIGPPPPDAPVVEDIAIDDMARSVGVPRAGLPFMRELIDAIEADDLVREKDIEFSGAEKADFVQRLLSNFPYLLGSRADDNASGLLVPFRGLEILVTFDPMRAGKVKRNPAGSYDRPSRQPAPGSVLATIDPDGELADIEGGDFTAVDTINAAYNTGAYTDTQSGQTGATRARISTTFGFGVPRTGLKTVSLGAAIAGTANQSNMSSTHIADAERGKVEDSRIMALLITYARANLSFKVREHKTGEQLKRWQLIKPTRIPESPREALLLWLALPYTKPAPSVQQTLTAIGSTIVDNARKLPRNYYASGLTNMPRLFDEILDTLRHNNVTLESGGIAHAELWQKLENLNTFLDDSVNNRDGYEFVLYGERGMPIAVVRIRSVRSPEREFREPPRLIGEMSDKVHLEDVRTAIDGTSASHTLNQSGTLGFPSMGFGSLVTASPSLSFTSSKSDAVSANRVGLNVLVPRYTGRTAAYRIKLDHHAEVRVLGVRGGQATTTTIESEALVRMPVREAFAFGFPVHYAALTEKALADAREKKSFARGINGRVTIPYAPDAVKDSGRGANDPMVKDAPLHVYDGKGIGMGLVRLADAAVDNIHRAIADEVKQYGFLLGDDPDASLAGHQRFDHQNRLLSQIGNMTLLNKMISTQGLDSHFDQIHQDGMTFTLHKRGGIARTDLEVDVVKITVKATQSADPEYVRTTNEFHTVNLAMGMDTAGQSTGQSRSMSGGVSLSGLFSYLKNAAMGATFQRSISASDSVSFLNNRPELLEFPGEVDEFKLTSDYRITFEYAHSGPRGLLLEGRRNEQVDVMGQTAVAHLLELGTEKQRGPQMTGPAKKDLLDQSLVYYIDTSGLRDVAGQVLKELVGPGETADPDISTFTSTIEIRAHLREILQGEYTTNQLFDTGFLTDTFGALDISGELQDVEFSGSTGEKFVKGDIKLLLSENRVTETETLGFTWGQLDVSGGGVVGTANLSGGVDMNRRWQWTTSTSSGRTGGKELIQLDFNHEYAFTGEVHFTVRGEQVKRTKFVPNRVTKHPGQTLKSKVMFIMAEPEALKRYAQASVPISDAQLVDALTRWKDEKLTLSSDVVAGALARWQKELVARIEALVARKVQMVAARRDAVARRDALVAENEALAADARAAGVEHLNLTERDDLLPRAEENVSQIDGFISTLDDLVVRLRGLTGDFARALVDVHRTGLWPVMDQDVRRDFEQTFAMQLGQAPDPFGYDDPPPDLRAYVAERQELSRARLRQVMTDWENKQLRLSGDLVAGILLRWTGSRTPSPTQARLAALLYERHSKGGLPIRTMHLRKKLDGKFGFDPVLPAPKTPLWHMTLPEYLTRDDRGGRILGHSGIQTFTRNDGETTYGIVRRLIDEVAPDMLTARTHLWSPERGLIGGTHGAVDALQGMLAKGRDLGLLEELLSPNGQSFYLINQVDWFLADVVEINLTSRLTSPPKIEEFVPNTGIEVYSHGYHSSSFTKSRSAGQTLTFAKLNAGGQKVKTGSGGASLKTSEAHNRGTNRAEQGVTEMTTYDWSGHYLTSFDDEMVVTVRRLKMPYRPLNNAALDLFAGYTQHGKTAQAKVPGRLVLQVPRSIAEAGVSHGPADYRNLGPLQKLPGNSFVAGTMLDDALPMAKKMLADLLDPGLVERLFGARADDPTSSSRSLPVLLSRLHMTNHLQEATGGASYEVARGLAMPGNGDTRIDINLKGDLYDFEVIAPIKEGTGTGRYSKHQSGTSAFASTNLARLEIDYSVDGHGPMGPGTPPRNNWDFGNSGSRLTSMNQNSTGTQNYRREQHAKEQGPVYLVRLRFRGRLTAARYEHYLSGGDPKHVGATHSDTISGDVYAELFQAEINELRERRTQEQTARKPPTSYWWPAMDVAQPFDLASMLANAAKQRLDGSRAYQSVARQIRDRVVPNRPIVLTADATAQATEKYRVLLPWAVRNMRADLRAAPASQDRTNMFRSLAKYDSQLIGELQRAGMPYLTPATYSVDEADEIIRNVQAAHNLLGGVPPLALPDEVSVIGRDPVYVARDVAHALATHVRVDVHRGDGTFYQRWINPEGHVHAFDPAHTRINPSDGRLYVPDPTSPGRRAFTADVAHRAGLLPESARTEVNVFAVEDANLARWYQIAMTRHQTLEQAVRAHIAHADDWLEKRDPRLPEQIRQAYQAQRFWEGEIRWRQNWDEDTADAIMMNDVAQGALTSLRAAAGAGPLPQDHDTYATSIARDLDLTSSWEGLLETRVAEAFQPSPLGATVRQLEQGLLVAGEGSISAFTTQGGNRFVAANQLGTIRWLEYPGGAVVARPSGRVTLSWDLAPGGEVLHPSAEFAELDLDPATFEWIRASIKEFVRVKSQPQRGAAAGPPPPGPGHFPPPAPGPYLAPPRPSALRVGGSRSTTSLPRPRRRARITAPLGRPAGLEIHNAYLYRTDDGDWDFRRPGEEVAGDLPVRHYAAFAWLAGNGPAEGITADDIERALTNTVDFLSSQGDFVPRARAAIIRLGRLPSSELARLPAQPAQGTWFVFSDDNDTGAAIYSNGMYRTYVPTTPGEQVRSLTPEELIRTIPPRASVISAPPLAPGTFRTVSIADTEPIDTESPGSFEESVVTFSSIPEEAAPDTTNGALQIHGQMSPDSHVYHRGDRLRIADRGASTNEGWRPVGKMSALRNLLWLLGGGRADRITADAVGERDRAEIMRFAQTGQVTDQTAVSDYLSRSLGLTVEVRSDLPADLAPGTRIWFIGPDQTGAAVVTRDGYRYFGGDIDHVLDLDGKGLNIMTAGADTLVIVRPDRTRRPSETGSRTSDVAGDAYRLLSRPPGGTRDVWTPLGDSDASRSTDPRPRTESSAESGAPGPLARREPGPASPVGPSPAEVVNQIRQAMPGRHTRKTGMIPKGLPEGTWILYSGHEGTGAMEATAEGFRIYAADRGTITHRSEQEVRTAFGRGLHSFEIAEPSRFAGPLLAPQSRPVPEHTATVTPPVPVLPSDRPTSRTAPAVTSPPAPVDTRPGTSWNAELAFGALEQRPWMLNEAMLDQMLNVLDLTRIQVPGDNNCFYHTLIAVVGPYLSRHIRGLNLQSRHPRVIRENIRILRNFLAERLEADFRVALRGLPSRYAQFFHFDNPADPRDEMARYAADIRRMDSWDNNAGDTVAELAFRELQIPGVLLQGQYSRDLGTAAPSDRIHIIRVPGHYLGARLTSRANTAIDSTGWTPLPPSSVDEGRQVFEARANEQAQRLQVAGALLDELVRAEAPNVLAEPLSEDYDRLVESYQRVVRTELDRFQIAEDETNFEAADVVVRAEARIDHMGRSAGDVEEAIVDFFGRYPQLLERLPELLERHPELVNRVPDLLVRFPSHLPEVPALLDRFPALLDRIPTLLDRLPELLRSRRLPGFLDRFPELLNRFPNILQQFPALLDRFPELLERMPDLLERSPEIIDRYLAEILRRHPNLLDQFPQILQRHPEIAYKYPGVLRR
jgi:hypothetical protein